MRFRDCLVDFSCSSFCFVHENVATYITYLIVDELVEGFLFQTRVELFFNFLVTIRLLDGAMQISRI